MVPSNTMYFFKQDSLVTRGSTKSFCDRRLANRLLRINKSEKIFVVRPLNR